MPSIAELQETKRREAEESEVEQMVVQTDGAEEAVETRRELCPEAYL